MARAHPTSSTPKHRPIAVMASSSSLALLHAAWITALVAVCLALCSIHSRKPSSSSSSSSRRRRGSRPASSSTHRCGSKESNGAGTAVGTAATATTPAKVSPTPSDTATASGAEADVVGGGPVTVIDVGTHGPIPPAFLPPSDPIPPRRSLSSGKHARFAERVGRIRSMRRGGSGEAAAATAAEDDVFVGCHRGGEVGEEGTLWTKTIILGERCRVPSSSDEDDGVDGVTAIRKWKSYRPRQPRSVPVTRSNSFAGVGSAAARRPTNPHF